ncbi:hypothetical protein SAMN05421781_0297 [Marinococcus luteus]|uniref:RiboL-PSP-HEPN domain-containing protein n=1 Tax=Marinococcus luteus TaxID=1122204 RepID=A0A1H2QGY4_9BACI|nr:hypothetical protein [Marinococcus luteus]SDW05884.1 hypothetical protein SAMN05421781_0297 [Marinococcus luteus]
MNIDYHLNRAKKMADNYQKLYIIEKYMKESLVNNELESNLYFHEYIPLLNENYFDKSVKMDLYKLIKVRNKICHMEVLDIEEESLLKKCYRDIIKNNINLHSK